MRKTLRVLVSLTLAVSFLSLATPIEAQTATGSFRVVQASPDTSLVAVFINDKAAVTDLKYQGISGYTSLPSGNYSLKIVTDASNNSSSLPPINIPNFSITAGSLTTLVVVGLLSNKTLNVLPLNDENSNSAADKARVRFIHASPDAPAVNVTAEGLGNVFNNISFKNTGSYVEAPAGTLKLSAKPVDSDQLVLSKTVTLEAGKVYTIFAVGQVSDKSLDVLLAVDSALSSMPAAGKGGSSNQSQFILEGSRQLELIILIVILLACCATLLRVSKQPNK